MIVFLNGQFVAEAEATVSVFDRAFLYGDGLFETMRVSNGKVFRWKQHMERLERGARFLGINIPFLHQALQNFASELIVRNQMPESLLRLTLSRGVGKRGYSPAGADSPTLVMTLHPVGETSSSPDRFDHDASQIPSPLRWRANTASFRLPAGEPLAMFKTCNKLSQVLARAEAEAADANEALLLNTDGFVVEAASSNLFWIDRGIIITSPLTSGILAGITREVVLELCTKLNQPFEESTIHHAALVKVDAAFLSLSSHGIVELSHIDNIKLGSSGVIRQLHQAYLALLITECS